MKALFVALDLNSGTGGMQRYCRDAVDALAASGCRTTVIAFRDTPGGTGVPAGVRYLAGGRRRVRTIVAFLAALWRERPDVVVIAHVLLAPLAFAVRLLAPRTHVVLIAYGVDVWQKPSVVRRTIVGVAIDRVVAISRTTARRMSIAYRLAPDRLTVVAPGVAKISSRLTDSPRNGNRLLTVARLNEADRDKGVERVVRALPAALAGFPHLEYHVVGGGPLRAEIATLAHRLGLGERVHLHGHVGNDEITALYNRSDVFIMPSRKEGFGIVYLEAWRHGLPVIAGNRDAGAEVVADGVTGLLVDPESTEEIAVAIKRLLGDPALRDALGEAGRAVVAERHSPAQFRAAFTAALGGRA